jgi:predicted dehydrogenase
VIADVDLGAALAAAGTAGGDVFATTDVDRVWAMSAANGGDIGLVVVCSPDRFHLEAVASAVANGVAAMVEKPLACDLDELEALDALLGGQPRITSCHPRRFDPPFIWCKDNLAGLAAEFGPLVTVRYDFSYHAPSKTGLHSGLLADHINHEVDLVNFLIGRSGARWVRLYDSEVRYAAVGVRDDGVAVTFEGTRMLDERRYPEWLELRFASATVRLDLAAGDATVVEHGTGATRVETCGATDYEVRSTRLAEHLVAWASGDVPSYLDVDDLRYNSAVAAGLTQCDSIRVDATGRIAGRGGAPAASAVHRGA